MQVVIDAGLAFYPNEVIEETDGTIIAQLDELVAGMGFVLVDDADCGLVFAETADVDQLVTVIEENIVPGLEEFFVTILDDEAFVGEADKSAVGFVKLIDFVLVRVFFAESIERQIRVLGGDELIFFMKGKFGRLFGGRVIGGRALKRRGF